MNAHRQQGFAQCKPLLISECLLCCAALRLRNNRRHLSWPDDLRRACTRGCFRLLFAISLSPMAPRTPPAVVPRSRSPHSGRRPDHLFSTAGQKGRGAMALSLDAAAEVFREAMRDTVKRYALWYLIQGVLLIATGVLAIISPVLSSAAVVALLGWLLIISGVVQGLSLIGARHVPHFWLQLISVILAVLIGCLFLRDPAQGLVTIALLLIVFFMIEGISKVVFALTIRPFPNWGWVLASGLVGILLALILWANLPVTALWLVGVLLGINLISVGAAIAYLAWQVRQS